MRRRRVKSILTLAGCMLFSATGGWLIGLDHGYDTGVKVTHAEYQSLIKTAQAEGLRSFRVEGLPARIVPDRVTVEIAGAGSDSLIK